MVELGPAVADAMVGGALCAACEGEEENQAVRVFALLD